MTSRPNASTSDRDALPEPGLLLALVQRAAALAERLAAATPLEATTPAMIDRLNRSVIRPLQSAAQAHTGSSAEAAPGAVPAVQAETSTQDELWSLTQTATRLRARYSQPTELQEATAALQQLACAAVPEPQRAERQAVLGSLLADWPAGLQIQTNGPYLATNLSRLTDWLGLPLPTVPQLALCRCGQSRTRPWCDGTHSTIGFDDARDPRRVPDRLDTYVGQEATILDNRGICQHAGYCTDRLPSVFRLRSEPFVTASGGRLDEIIRAVRDCPSGALGLALDGVQERAIAEYHGTRPPAVEVTRDGPYRVTGGLPLVDQHGQPQLRAAGATNEHYALCRCGASWNKPFCSGMHYAVPFHDPVLPADGRPTLFAWCGGLPALTRLTRRFLETLVPQDDLLNRVYHQIGPDYARRMARRLGQLLGGPAIDEPAPVGAAEGVDTDSQPPSLLADLLGSGLDESQRARWVALLLQSADEVGLPTDAAFRAAWVALLEWVSRAGLEGRPPTTVRWDWLTNAEVVLGASAAESQPRTAAAVAAPAVPPRVEDQPSGDVLSFERDIRPLFRATDRQAMSYAFDLWDHAQVRQHGQAILHTVRAGTMPCDTAWPDADVERFERWLRGGAAP